jgi:hypothetical protein
MAPFLWALFLALPCGVAAISGGGYVAARIRRPPGMRGRWEWPLRIAVFVAVATIGFTLLLVGGVFLAMRLGL